tara:strand:+ start:2984 stop:3226 length:243 start_codon:yes stop_codon:yes gene_type:complete
MNNFDVFKGNQFSWHGTHGHSTFSELGCMPSKFYVISSRTGLMKFFALDTECPGYEDHWDGEFVRLVDADRKVFITVGAD